MRCIWVR